MENKKNSIKDRMNDGSHFEKLSKEKAAKLIAKRDNISIEEALEYIDKQNVNTDNENNNAK